MTEGSEAAPEAGSPAAGAEASVAAIALALALEKEPGEPNDRLATFLDKQSRMLDMQMEHLHEQRELLLSRLRLGRFGDRVKVALQVMTAVVGLVIVTALAVMVWEASQSGGLLIEPFSVPPDLAQRGVTGEVVAARLLDRVAAMQAETSSLRAPKSYANNWDQQDIKINIPETGVSLAELDDLLREKLGHDTHITGEVVRTQTGLSLTARAGGEGADSVTGSEADLDALVLKLSESIYRMTQPYRYAVWLNAHDRVAEGLVIFEALARTGPMEERSWGYNGWANAIRQFDGIDAARKLYEQGVLAGPDNVLPRSNLAALSAHKGLPEQSIRDYQAAISLLSGGGRELIRLDMLPVQPKLMQANIDQQLGAFHDATLAVADAIASGVPLANAGDLLVRSQSGEHDLAAARATQAGPLVAGRVNVNVAALQSIQTAMLIATEGQDWGAVRSEGASIEPLVQKYPGLRTYLPTMTAPTLAYAQARMGDVAGAAAVIATTPVECYPCLRTRARIAELQGDHAGADGWFARAIAGQKSIPFAYSEWGEALLARGDITGAIAQFTLAAERGPHFADPLELWGEALVRKGDVPGAIEKFTAAEEYAPNWGRLHLKWAEALLAAGKRDEAQKHFAMASQLELSAADKAELAKAITPI